MPRSKSSSTKRSAHSTDKVVTTPDVVSSAGADTMPNNSAQQNAEAKPPQKGVTEAQLAQLARAKAAAQTQLTPEGFTRFCTAIDGIIHEPKRIHIALDYAETCPKLAAAIGEQVIDDISTCILSLSSAARSVVSLLLQKLPLAASRLNTAQAFASFLQLCQDIAQKAPSGLKPFLENLHYLLEHLGLTGLRHWALWGAQAYSGNYYGQLAYFRLESEPAKTLFDQERSGSLFVDQQRKLHYYTRALWNRPFMLRPISGELKSRRVARPKVEGIAVNLPEAWDNFGEIDGPQLYLASAVHGASHLVYGGQTILADDLTQAQLHCIALFYDAQIEAIAIARFPGLQRLWGAFFSQYADKGDADIAPDSMLDLCMRMGHTLLDKAQLDEHSIINKLATEHHQALDDSCQLSVDLAKQQGLAFFDWLREQTQILSLRDLETIPLPYRSDNRHLWEYTPEEREFIDADHVHDSQESRTRDGASSSEQTGQPDDSGGEAAGEDADNEPLAIPYELLGLSEPTQLSSQQPGVEHYYSEWDYALQMLRPKWATVIEREVPAGDASIMDGILTQHKGVATRLRHLVDAMQPQGLVRQRGYEDGEQIDIEAAIRAMIDIRRGIMPDPKINIRIKHHERDFALLLMMDLSQSTNDRIDGTKRGQPGYREAKSILDLTREATGLLAWAIDSIGDNFAIHGFSSDGRNDVRYFRFKDFDQGYDESARARMASMHGSYSTRMGAALRHGAAHLAQTTESKKVVLLITDGAPSDIDEKDPDYLRFDCKKAVEELHSQGMHTYCITLDPKADRYVTDIFGANHYTIVDNVEALPNRLANVFASLTT